MNSIEIRVHWKTVKEGWNQERKQAREYMTGGDICVPVFQCTQACVILWWTTEELFLGDPGFLVFLLQSGTFMLASMEKIGTVEILIGFINSFTMLCEVVAQEMCVIAGLLVCGLEELVK